MNNRGYMIAGVAVILLGLVLPNIEAMTTVVIDTQSPTFLSTVSYPASTDQNVPSIITQIGGATDFWVAVKDPGSGIKNVQVICTATDGSYSGDAYCIRGEDLALSGTLWEIWKWDAPALVDGKLYQFRWIATDYANHQGSLKTYGGYGDSDGYFTLNNNQITSTTQTVTLGTRNLDVAFHANEAASNIVSISVKIYKASILIKSAQLTKIDNDDWRTDEFYTFFADGTYTIEGYIDMSTKSLLKMSIIQQIGEGNGLDTGYTNTQIMTFIAGGAMLLLGVTRRED